MAGIGFEIRKLLGKQSILSHFNAYLYAGAVSSGPWVLSFLGIFLINLLTIPVVRPVEHVTQFQTSVTYIIVLSLIATGFVQLAFTRYISDRLFERRDELVLPCFHGAILLVTLAAGTLGILAALTLFPTQSFLYRSEMAASFVVMCDIWIATLFLSGMKKYKTILAMFLVGYSITVGGAWSLRFHGLEGLLFGFLVGHVVLLLGMMALILREFPSNRLVSFDFLRPRRIYWSLVLTGFVYYLAIWADKFLFWFHPTTGQPIVGPLRASTLYDIPIFLAYLSIIPGMAVFLVRMETDFVEHYRRFYDAVREGGTLSYIEEVRGDMVQSVRTGIGEILKIQAIAVLFTVVAGPSILRALGISPMYQALLFIDVVAAGLQVVFLGIMNVVYYLDKRGIALGLSALFLGTNIAFTLASMRLGIAYYGYGFALSLLVTVITGMVLLNRELELLEYDTFMLQTQRQLEVH